jgi:DtxR family transcriptional regulator, Mn-dependent transcriptional regulator
MLPSHTVENYLKAIFQAQSGLPSAESLVPMGQLASALSVVPGTATTMVKALAESGLVRYEPYAGVRLTPAGEKLAALVLRRHRLVELFLVKVMGMNWTEVHDEAELLEHAVSDRLIERIDAMLGRPSVDPHGDPIPGPEGTVDRFEYDTLLTCPLRAPVTVSRVSDQDSEFLKFVERHDLKPGEVVQVEERDPSADSVRLRGRNDREITIGARAASKVLVRALRIAVAILSLSGPAFAQAVALTPASEPFQIMDNSFLVEEAFNQPAGIFQNILGVVRSGDAWAAAFTQEWPVGSEAHQFSYSAAVLDSGTHVGFGDVFLTYRYQASTEAAGRPAFSPRISVILPSGSAARGLGDGSFGLELNLPVSRQAGDWQWHGNGGVRWLTDADAGDETGREERLVSPFVAGSVIYRLRPMLYLMLESVVGFDESIHPDGTGRHTSFTLSPGLRGGWNLADHQLVLGAALPITWTDRASNTGLFLYLSYELGF